MLSDSALISLIENFPVSASLKAADSGKFIVNNVHNSRQFGIENPADMAGLTIRDVSFRRPDWGLLFSTSVEQLDLRVRETKCHAVGKNEFFDDNGEVQLEILTKIPVLGSRGNVLAIATYREDITRTLAPIKIYLMYRKFYGVPEAVRRVVAFLDIQRYFTAMPTDAQLQVFFLKWEGWTNKQIARRLGISDRTVESHCCALQRKIAHGNIFQVISLMKRNVPCPHNAIHC